MGVDYLYSFDGSAGVFICLFVEGYCHFITFVSLFHCPGSCCLFIFGGEGDSLFGAILIDRPVFVHHANSVTFAGKGKEGEHKSIKVFIAVYDLTVGGAIDSVADGARGTVFYALDSSFYEVFFLAADGGQRKHGEKYRRDDEFLHGRGF